MKRVTISVTFDCDEQTAKTVEGLSLDRFPSAYEMHHFATRSAAGSLFTSIETKELYHVRVPVPEDQVNMLVNKGDITIQGYLAICGNPNYYTKGEAVKKARIFDGKVVKAE